MACENYSTSVILGPNYSENHDVACESVSGVSNPLTSKLLGTTALLCASEVKKNQLTATQAVNILKIRIWLGIQAILVAPRRAPIRHGRIR